MTKPRTVHDDARLLAKSLRSAAEAARRLGWEQQALTYEGEADATDRAAAAKVRLGDWPEV